MKGKKIDNRESCKEYKIIPILSQLVPSLKTQIQQTHAQQLQIHLQNYPKKKKK